MRYYDIAIRGKLSSSELVRACIEKSRREVNFEICQKNSMWDSRTETIWDDALSPTPFDLEGIVRKVHGTASGAGKWRTIKQEEYGNRIE